MAILIEISAEGLADKIGGLQAVLRQVYSTMIVHCSELIGVSRGLAGFATIWFIAARIWGPLTRAERIDVYPLLRPFSIGILILLFPSVITLINGILQPVSDGTGALVKDGDKAVAVLLQQQQEALNNSSEWQMYVGPAGGGSLDKWEELSGEADSGLVSGISNRLKFEMAKASYNVKNSVKVWMSEILQVLFEAASLCINTVRTFYLIILAIFGPLAFGLSVFEGFGSILRNWLARYINVFLWLPIANIFGSLISQIQQEMLKLSVDQLNATGQTSFGPTDAAYIIFLIMAIMGYFTVPTITNFIIHAGTQGLYMGRTRLPGN